MLLHHQLFLKMQAEQKTRTVSDDQHMLQYSQIILTINTTTIRPGNHRNHNRGCTDSRQKCLWQKCQTHAGLMLGKYESIFAQPHGTTFESVTVVSNRLVTWKWVKKQKIFSTCLNCLCSTYRSLLSFRSSRSSPFCAIFQESYRIRRL